MQDEALPVLLDREHGAEGDRVAVDADRRPLVGDRAAVDDGALPRRQAHVAVGLEAGGGGDADQQHGDAGVDDVAAVAAAVAGDDPDQRRRHRAAAERAPRRRAAPELLRQAGQGEGGEDEEGQRPGRVGGVAEQRQPQADGDRDDRRHEEDPLRRRPS